MLRRWTKAGQIWMITAFGWVAACKTVRTVRGPAKPSVKKMAEEFVDGELSPALPTPRPSWEGNLRRAPTMCNARIAFHQ